MKLRDVAVALHLLQNKASSSDFNDAKKLLVKACKIQSQKTDDRACQDSIFSFNVKKGTDNDLGRNLNNKVDAIVFNITESEPDFIFKLCDRVNSNLSLAGVYGDELRSALPRGVRATPETVRRANEFTAMSEAAATSSSELIAQSAHRRNMSGLVDALKQQYQAPKLVQQYSPGRGVSGRDGVNGRDGRDGGGRPFGDIRSGNASANAGHVVINNPPLTKGIDDPRHPSDVVQLELLKALVDSHQNHINDLKGLLVQARNSTDESASSSRSSSSTLGSNDLNSSFFSNDSISTVDSNEHRSSSVATIPEVLTRNGPERTSVLIPATSQVKTSFVTQVAFDVGALEFKNFEPQGLEDLRTNTESVKAEPRHSRVQIIRDVADLRQQVSAFAITLVNDDSNIRSGAKIAHAREGLAHVEAGLESLSKDLNNSTQFDSVRDRYIALSYQFESVKLELDRRVTLNPAVEVRLVVPSPHDPIAGQTDNGVKGLSFQEKLDFFKTKETLSKSYVPTLSNEDGAKVYTGNTWEVTGASMFRGGPGSTTGPTVMNWANNAH